MVSWEEKEGEVGAGTKLCIASDKQEHMQITVAVVGIKTAVSNSFQD